MHMQPVQEGKLDIHWRYKKKSDISATLFLYLSERMLLVFLLCLVSLEKLILNI